MKFIGLKIFQSTSEKFKIFKALVCFFKRLAVSLFLKQVDLLNLCGKDSHFSAEALSTMSHAASSIFTRCRYGPINLPSGA